MLCEAPKPNRHWSVSEVSVCTARASTYHTVTQTATSTRNRQESHQQKNNRRPKETRKQRDSLNQSKKTGRHQPKMNVKKHQTETNRETLRDKASHNQQDNQLHHQCQSDHQTIPYYHMYAKPLKQKKFARSLQKQLEQHLRQQGSTKPLTGGQVLRR